jgi:hypothetical protein
VTPTNLSKASTDFAVNNARSPNPPHARRRSAPPPTRTIPHNPGSALLPRTSLFDPWCIDYSGSASPWA